MFHILILISKRNTDCNSETTVANKGLNVPPTLQTTFLMNKSFACPNLMFYMSRFFDIQKDANYVLLCANYVVLKT